VSAPDESASLDTLQLRTEIAQLRTELKADRADRTVLIKTLRELIEALGRPKTRESVINLPSGPVKMRVEEH
jgi:outer membrane protein TolC